MGDPPRPTSAEAMEQLAVAQRPALATARDRRRHAMAGVASGVGFGLYTVIAAAVGGEDPWFTILLLVFVGAQSLVAWWQGQSTSLPRHGKALGWVGFVASMIAFTVGMVVLNRAEPAGPDPWLQCLVFVGVAAPMSLVGWLVLRSGRR